MIRSVRFASAALLASVATPFALAAHTHIPTPSTWALNVSESNFGDGPSMKSDVFVMVADTEQHGKYTDVTVDGDGKTWKTSWSGAEDGKPYPITGMPGGTYSSDAATDVSVMTYPDATTITCDFSLSANKKKYINKCVARTKAGKQTNQTMVYDRTK